MFPTNTVIIFGAVTNYLHVFSSSILSSFSSDKIKHTHAHAHARAHTHTHTLSKVPVLS